MNGGKSDASTSTDDVKDRPLCLFYFTHPFGVLSPEPPTITGAPASVTRAFLNMEPISPFYWPGSGAAAAAASTPDDSYRSSSPSTMHYDLGDATVHHHPVSVVSVPRARRCTVELPRRDSTLSSSLFAGDLWFPSSGSSRVDFQRRAPCSRILPPLQLPSPKDLTDDCSSEDIWPKKYLSKFSLPPIELPPARVILVRPKGREQPSSVESVGTVKESKCRRKLGVNKTRRWRRRRRAQGRGGDVRRVISCLMRRDLRGSEGGRRQEYGAAPAAALHNALTTIREAWAEPTSLRDRCRVLSRMYSRGSAIERDQPVERDSEREPDASVTATMTRTQLDELQPRRDASPGLMRRRYSVPETIMRKYRLAQQNSDTEETPECCGRMGPPTPLRVLLDTPRSAGESPRHLRRDRELMRKSALLRRLWARPPAAAAGGPAACPACCCEARSLTGSRDRLHPAAPATPDTDAPRARLFSYDESDAFSSSLTTAKETPVSTELAPLLERRFESRLPGASIRDEDSDAPLSPRRLPLPCTYEVLEVVVSESASSSPAEAGLPVQAASHRAPADLDLDEYVSRVLLESLNSLTDRLECMNATVGADRKLSVVEKEIKVRLQNAAVNTIVHLSPTSNNQIIFGNEELGNEERRDRCNNLRAPSPPAARSRDGDNNNGSPSPSPPPTPTPTPRNASFDIQHDNVNRAVLQQIQKLFRDELRREEYEGSGGAVSDVKISNVTAFLSGEAAGDSGSAESHDADGECCVGVGAGNYFRSLARAALVPRRCAAPRTASMEVHASSSSGAEADAFAEDAASLVDSLDDPASPREPPLPREAGAAFFVRIRDSAAPERARVAECMPDRIRQKLHRRHRTRELRAECARQSKVRQLRDELQSRRLADSSSSAVRQRPERRPPAREPREARSRRPERARLPAEPAARPSGGERGPRRIYQKSEIREGDKCIEILEILEYSHASRSSESTPTDESAERGRGRPSRIPVPVPAAEHMRLTGGHAAPAELWLGSARPPQAETRERSNSLRFKRVFDMIPEERAGLGCESPADAEHADGVRRASEPTASPAPAPAPAPLQSPRRVATRSAGTSPPGEARRVRSQTTMTSPSNRSVATSPWRAPPPAPREGTRSSDPARPEDERRSATCAESAAEDASAERAQHRGQRRAPAAGAWRRPSVGESGSSSSGEHSDGSLLCSLAPRWLSTPRRRARRVAAPAPAGAGSWSVTVAGSCRTALPADVEMRLRFPPDRSPVAAPTPARHQECACATCSGPPAPAAALPLARSVSRQDRLTLTMKKEAQDSSIVATQSTRKSCEPLPDLEAYRASRTKLKSSVKTRRGYSLHCWLPDDEREPIRANNGLSVLGCAIIPELKPRVPTMSERDLTRVYTPRHYLRS